MFTKPSNCFDRWRDFECSEVRTEYQFRVRVSVGYASSGPRDDRGECSWKRRERTLTTGPSFDRLTPLYPCSNESSLNYWLPIPRSFLSHRGNDGRGGRILILWTHIVLFVRTFLDFSLFFSSSWRSPGVLYSFLWYYWGNTKE